MVHSRSRSALIVLAGSAVLLAACSALPAPTSAPTTVPAAAKVEGIPAEAHPEVERVSLEEAKAAFLADSAVFVDVRSIGKYELGHIPGSIHLFFATLEQHLDELDKQKWIITYCDCPPHEGDSAIAAAVLLENGFPKVAPLTGGFAAWKEAGLPIEE